MGGALVCEWRAVGVCVRQRTGAANITATLRHHAQGSPRFTSNAKASETTTSGTVLSKVNQSVLPSERHMSGSLNASV